MESLGTGGAKELRLFLPFYPFTFLPLKALLPFLVKQGNLFLTQLIFQFRNFGILLLKHCLHILNHCLQILNR